MKKDITIAFTGTIISLCNYVILAISQLKSMLKTASSYKISEIYMPYFKHMQMSKQAENSVSKTWKNYISYK